MPSSFAEAQKLNAHLPQTGEIWRLYESLQQVLETMHTFCFDHGIVPIACERMVALHFHIQENFQCKRYKSTTGAYAALALDLAILE